ncbi:LacI family DNA-binding transcriptional regulator [Kribbella sp. NPDC055071]
MARVRTTIDVLEMVTGRRDDFGRPTQRRPTVADVARVADVSLMTVSRVVNQVVTVDPELRNRVLAAIATTGYQRNRTAHALRSAQLGTSVGLLIEDLANPFYSAIAAGAADVALEHNTLLFTASSEEDPQREEQLLMAMCERRVNGLLIVPTSSDHSYLQQEVALGTHVVCLDRQAKGLKSDAVVIDDKGGTQQAIEYVLSRGHRRIGVLMDSPEIATMRIRLETAQVELASAGRPVDPGMVRDDVHDPAAAGAAVLELLAAPDPPTAVYCGNNRITMGVIEALMGTDADLDVVGFDDFEAAPLMPRPVTLVSFDARAIGRRGAELLFRRIDGATGRRRRVVIPTHLVTHGLGTTTTPS